jgi:multiple sugar transport system permease protein
MLSKRWDATGRWCISLALLLIVFVGPFWGIVATAFSGAPVKPGELLAWPNQFSFENHLCVDGYWRLAVSAELHSGGVLWHHRSAGVGQRALAAYALARKKFRGVALVSW